MLPDYSQDRRRMETLYQRSRRGRKQLGYEYTKKTKSFGMFKNCYVCRKRFPINEFKQYYNQNVNRKYVYAICKICLKQKSKKDRSKQKIKAFLIIQDEIKCVRCGCLDIRFLEINHKIGGGNKEAKKKGGAGQIIIQDIISGRRKTDDLELLCRPCNHIHYLELKFKEKIPLKVVWENNNAL